MYATATHMGDGCDMRISYSVHNKYSIAVADERQWVQLFFMSETAAAAAAARTSVCSSVRYYAAVADRRKAVVVAWDSSRVFIRQLSCCCSW